MHNLLLRIGNKFRTYRQVCRILEARVRAIPDRKVDITQKALRHASIAVFARRQEDRPRQKTVTCKIL